ncbi:5-methylcytosine restriction system specificity protein McrC [Acetobacter malorum]|uniref:5-methylcytosine restriction system specificity protein McrC n=1 Tax=Acetobacter malorum TaxID=178901 RepID=UPI0039E7C6FF
MQFGDIPLRNIWLLFLYAANLVQFKDEFSADVEVATDLPDLIGRLLAHSVEKRARRPLTRNYQTENATLSRVRGRIDLVDTFTRRLLDRGQVSCIFETHTFNTPRNRLVRSALDQLGKRLRNNDTAHRCRHLARELTSLGIGPDHPGRAELAKDQIGRNDKTDLIMVRLAELVFTIAIPTETEGLHKLPRAEATTHLIRKLFEKAIGNALRLELEPEGWRINQGHRLKWPVTECSSGLTAMLPGMATDIELLHPPTQRKIIIDTKFTHIFTRSQFRTEILKSGYLYQLYAYLRTQEDACTSSDLLTEGMLLHPQTGEAICEHATIQGHTLHFRTIDMTADPQAFEKALRHLII